MDEICSSSICSQGYCPQLWNNISTSYLYPIGGSENKRSVFCWASSVQYLYCTWSVTLLNALEGIFEITGHNWWWAKTLRFHSFKFQNNILERLLSYLWDQYFILKIFWQILNFSLSYYLGDAMLCFNLEGVYVVFLSVMLVVLSWDLELWNVHHWVTDNLIVLTNTMLNSTSRGKES